MFLQKFLFLNITFTLRNCFIFVSWYVEQLAWNPNLGSHQWLAVAGSAGLLRILCVQNVGAHQAVKRVADLVGV